MKIACLTFSSNGEKIGDRIKDTLEHDVNVFNRSDYSDNLKDFCKSAFENFDALIFISSTGIAVRLIAPYVKSKITDPAVIVVDDMGKYSISLLSGHIGGANTLCEKIACCINAQAIVTTASDARDIEAIDTFAMKNNLYIESMEDAKILTALMVDGKKIKLTSEVKLSIKYNNIVESPEDADGYIFVTSNENIECNKPFCILRPKNLHLGIGCKKGKTMEEIILLANETMKKYNLSMKAVKSISTIEVKKDEKGILDLVDYLCCDFNVFLRNDIEKVQDRFNKSDFVKNNVGVTSVAEPCAYLAGENIIVARQALNGVTLAISKEDM